MRACLQLARDVMCEQSAACIFIQAHVLRLRAHAPACSTMSTTDLSIYTPSCMTDLCGLQIISVHAMRTHVAHRCVTVTMCAYITLFTLLWLTPCSVVLGAALLKLRHDELLAGFDHLQVADAWDGKRTSHSRDREAFHVDLRGI